MKVYEAIQMLETMPAGAEVSAVVLEAAVERNKKVMKNEIEEMLARHAVKAIGYESFLKPAGYVRSVYINYPRSHRINFDDAYDYVYVDCGGFFDIYKRGYKEPKVEVTIGGK